jgi:D-glycero-D-manno-heptose 1,7-bisphosphate phosphatase
MMNRPAVFLDRDGTVNEQMGYINHISRFHLLPGVADAIRLLNQQEIPVVVVSNQSGLARGYFPQDLLREVHRKMKDLLAKQGAHLDGIYVCPHHPEAKKIQYRQECTCRKPKTGLLERAALDLQLDLARSFLVGDRWSDIECAVRAGCTPVLVLTGYGKGEYMYIGPEREIQPEFVAENLPEAVRWIISRIGEGNARQRD